MKPFQTLFLSTGSRLLLFSLLALSSASAQLTWDPNGATTPDPSDGAGVWTTTSSGTPAATWWNGSTQVIWDNTTHATTRAIFGAGTTTGLAGAIDLGGATINVGSIQFDSIKLPAAAMAGPPAVPAGPEEAYSFSNGTLNMAAGSSLDLRASSSTSNSVLGRIRFAANSVIAGNNISIVNNQGGNTSFGLIQMSSTANTWTGTLSMTGSSGGMFVEALNIGAVNTLSKIDVNSNATFVVNYSSTTPLAVPLELAGSGAGSRGALRFDQSRTLDGDIVLTAGTRLATNGGSIVGTLNGTISGNFGIAMDHTGTTVVGGLVFTKDNTFTTLLVTKGNAQIGVAGAGTSGTGLVTLNGSTATVSGTGTLKGGLSVNNGVVRPGDSLGVGRGTLNVIGAVNLAPAALRTVAEFTLAAPAGISDKINVTTGGLTLSNNSNMVVTFDASYTTPTLGDQWIIAAWDGALTPGTFDTGADFRTGADSDLNEGNINLPDISASGLKWDVNLGPNSLVAIIIPEPSSMALAGLALSAFALRRRRIA